MKCVICGEDASVLDIVEYEKYHGMPKVIEALCTKHYNDRYLQE